MNPTQQITTDSISADAAQPPTMNLNLARFVGLGKKILSEESPATLVPADELVVGTDFP